MTTVVLPLPNVKRKTEARPRKCLYCPSELLQGWGQVRKRVRDPKVRQVWVPRYRCCSCRRTFRHYPEGVSAAQQTERLRMLAVLCWRLGLSYRRVAGLLAGLGMRLSRMTGWRNVQHMAEKQRQQNRGKPVRVLGLDGAYVRAGGRIRPVLVAVDLGNGQVVEIGAVDEADPQAVRRWLQPLIRPLGVSAVVTDDLATYRQVADELELAHQVCQLHLRRWVGRALAQRQKDLPPEWLGVLHEVERLIDELPAEGSRRLFALWKELPGRRGAVDQKRSPLEKFRDLLQRLSENWERYRVFAYDEGAPWTNNGSEQAIGRMKMRSRTVRGYKSRQGMLNGLLVAGLQVK